MKYNMLYMRVFGCRSLEVLSEKIEPYVIDIDWIEGKDVFEIEMYEDTDPPTILNKVKNSFSAEHIIELIHDECIKEIHAQGGYSRSVRGANIIKTGDITYEWYNHFNHGLLGQ